MATKPDAPSVKPLYGVSHTGMTFDFDDGDDNGYPVTVRQYQYSLSSAFAGSGSLPAPSTGIVSQANLTPGKTYYWRARTQNAGGYSDWSKTASASTYPGVLISLNGSWQLAIPYVRVSGIWKACIPYVNVNGIWKIGTG